ncbi:MAG: radical SAM protein [Promethearchaeota archaeon]
MVETKKSKLPVSLDLQVTENCNLRCKMCYFWGEKGCFTRESSQNKPKMLDIDLIKRVIGELDQGPAYISLFGGEPLTYPYLEELIKTVKEAKFHINTPTNGTLLDKDAKMLVKTKFDLIRLSIDGTRKVNDLQRGLGSYDRAMYGIECLAEEKLKSNSKIPHIEILYTITPLTYTVIEDFFMNNLNLSLYEDVTFQMENFITEEMGNAYAIWMESEFGIKSDKYWHGMVRSPNYFDQMDVKELTRQVCNVLKYLTNHGKKARILPPTCSYNNFNAYFKADWNKMNDRYNGCPAPWGGINITASGDVAPCHIFFDFTLGNLYEQSLDEIWNGGLFNRFRNYMKQSLLLPICNGCCVLYLVGRKIK